MLFDKYQVSLTFTEPLLGGAPKNPKVFETYLAGRAAKRMTPEGRVSAEALSELMAEEAGALPEGDEKGWTGFYSDDKGMFLWDNQIKGFIKEAAAILKNALGEGESISALRSKLDNFLYVFPRRIRPVGAVVMEPLERPLRAMTMQGPRVSLIRSDQIAAGASVSFELEVLHVVQKGKVVISQELIEEILSFGRLKGLGQWRNGSFGRFTYTLAKA
mgnify:CR=1 FL=1